MEVFAVSAVPKPSFYTFICPIEQKRGYKSLPFALVYMLSPSLHAPPPPLLALPSLCLPYVGESSPARLHWSSQAGCAVHMQAAVILHFLFSSSEQSISSCLRLVFVNNVNVLRLLYIVYT